MKPAAPSSLAVASMRSGELELTATRAPSATSSAAIPRPIPFDAPMTSATRSDSPRSMAGPSHTSGMILAAVYFTFAYRMFFRTPRPATAPMPK